MKRFLSNWRKITHHNWPLSVIEKGYQLQFASTPQPWRQYKLKLSEEDQRAVNTAVDQFLTAGIIEKSSDQQSGYLSNFFTIQEETKRRPILDCQKLNKFLQVQHFKMEGVPALRDIVEENDYMCKLDLKDAYVVVPIHEASKKYLTFQNNGIVYNYKSLAFGLSIAPRVFSKLMRYAVEPLRRQGIRMVYYLDDICILEQSKEKLVQITNYMIQHLESLGFIINKKKSCLIPQKKQDYLGFKFNTKTMKISLPQEKLNKLMTRVRQAELQKKRSCRWVASLLGKMTSVIPAIGEALLHIRYLQADLAKSLRRHNNNWEKECKMSTQGKQELSWWKNWMVKNNGLPIHKKKTEAPQIIIHVDASDIGWGVHSKLIQVNGYWKEAEKDQSINVRELRTIYMALKLHSKKLDTGSTIKMFTDNITALKYVTKAGGTSSPILQDLAIQIQQVCNDHQFHVQYQHIQGVKNVEADRLSRIKKPLYESNIPKKFFKKILRCWGPRTIDAFAARHNHQLPK